jgi:nucleoside-triphosphatase THEP1
LAKGTKEWRAKTVREDRRYRHIFLRAPPGIGKSTVIRHVIENLGPVRVGGFLTYFGADRDRPDKRLYLRRADEAAVYDEAHAVACFSGSSPPQICTDRFNIFGRAYIDGMKNPDILIFDECSRPESHALDFQAFILAALDGDLPVLGVYRITADGQWTKQIEDHPAVHVVDLTLENRDRITRQLSAHYTSLFAGLSESGSNRNVEFRTE